MKLVTFRSHSSRISRVGMLSDRGVNDSDLRVIDLLACAERENRSSLLPALLNMNALIAHWSKIRPFCEEILNRTSKVAPSFSQKEVQLLAPIERPRTLRDAYAFRAHVEAGRRNRGLPMIPEYDEFPVFYFSNPNPIFGPGPVPIPEYAWDGLDYELEWAAVVGRDGKNLSVQEADEAIFGFMIFNDWSARAEQMREMKLNLGPAKGKDFASSFGPYLVPKEDLYNHSETTPKGRQYRLEMRAAVNGVELSRGNTGEMQFTFAEILSRVSRGVDLFCGEVIGSGTVGTGCLLELNGSKPNTTPLWLKAGDQVELTIQELGALKNTVVRDAEA